MTDKQIMKKAIDTYGKDMQCMVAIEEMSELIKEISKDKRYANNKEHIIEEIADVSIMLEQLKIIYAIDESDIQKVHNAKMKRLREKVQNDN